MAHDLFKEIIPSIIGDKNGKKAILDIEEEEFNPFVVNRIASNYTDCVFYLQFINENHRVSNIIKYQYLNNRIRGFPRGFVKWNKRISNENIELLCKYYKIGTIAAKQYLEILTEEQINEIKNKYIGGIVK